MIIEIQNIPLADLASLPDSAGDRRFESVLLAHRHGVPVPPILLTITTRRGGDPYDLLDGCHRLAAARALGHETIPAVVITQFGAARMEALTAYRDFVRQHHERHGDGPADPHWLAQLAREPAGNKVFGLSSGPPPAGTPKRAKAASHDRRTRTPRRKNHT